MKEKRPPLNWNWFLPAFLYVAIGELFILKYSLRLFPQQTPLLCVGYLVGTLLLLLCYDKTVARLSPKLILSGIIALLLTLAWIQFKIDPYSIKVDRWSAIHGFLQNLLDGEYPYAAKTHLGGYGSPFPVWQILHLPFYLLGNVGWSFLPVFLLFLHSFSLNHGNEQSLKAGVFLLASPAFIYEIMVRSDLMTNFLFVTALIGYFIHYRINIQHHGWLVALTCGLLLSTRLAAIFPFCMLYFKESLSTKKTLFVICGTLAVFSATFLPFVFSQQFSTFNPFILQTRQGHAIDLLFLILCGILLALTHKQCLNKYYFHTALLLMLLVLITFIHTMAQWNLWNQLFASVFDITYFNMSLPFIVCSLAMGYTTEWGSGTYRLKNK